jgi:TolA-binding protein
MFCVRFIGAAPVCILGMEEIMVRRRGSGSSDQSQPGADTPKLPLDATLLDLKATLEAVQPKDTVLTQQISDLKAELDAKDTLIAKLQTDAQQAEQLRAEAQQVEQLKSELAEAKQMILKLSEANAKPLVAISPLHTPAAPKAEAKVDAKTVAKAAPKSTLQIESSVAAHNSKHETALRKILQHPTQPGLPPSMPSEKEGKLSEIEIGWMD